MLTLVLLKLISDLGLYYTFAGFFALFAGADAFLLLLGFILQAMAGFLTYPLRERGVLRFLPLFLLAVCFVLPGCGLAERLTLVPPAVYVIYLVVKRLYLPEWYAQVQIFRVSWMALLVFVVFALLMGCLKQLVAVTVPAGVTALICCVLLMRSLRHDRSVYQSPRFQAMNLATAAGVVLGALALSSDAFLGAAAAVLTWIYQTVCYPILMIFVYLLVGIVQVIAWLFSWVQFGDLEQESSEVTVNTSGIEDMIEGMETGRNSDVFMRVVTALVLIAVAVALFFIFRWLSNRAHRDMAETAVGERTKVERKQVGRRFSFMSSPVERVRLQYRKYLKLCRTNGFAFEKSETSQEIEEKTGTAMDMENVHAMRQIYIKARYHGEASKEDAAEAKRFYQSLAASAGKQQK